MAAPISVPPLPAQSATKVVLVQAVDGTGGMSCASGCIRHLFLPACKYCKGSKLPTQLKPFENESIPRLSDGYKLNCMYPLADGISNRLSLVCPQAYLNMTAHPESDCRIRHDVEHIRPFAHMTTTLGILLFNSTPF